MGLQHSTCPFLHDDDDDFDYDDDDEDIINQSNPVEYIGVYSQRKAGAFPYYYRSRYSMPVGFRVCVCVNVILDKRMVVTHRDDLSTSTSRPVEWNRLITHTYSPSKNV